MASLKLLSRAQCLLLSTSLLVYVCTASSVNITSSPSSKVIVLGDNATFYCSGSGPSFHLIIKNPMILNDPFILRSTVTSPDHIHDTYGIISASITRQCTGGEYECEHTAMVTLEARMDTNNTELNCVVYSLDSKMSVGDPATLIVIGPPTSPSSLTLHPVLINSELWEFSAVWNTPFSHPNHTISQYYLTVSNIRNSASYEMSIENEKPTNDVMLPLPNGTSACDIVTVTVRAVNDLGPSEPALANISIPQVPNDTVSASTNVSFKSDGTPVIFLEIQFPILCPLERLNYSILLIQMNDRRETVISEVQRSAMSPTEPVSEMIDSNLEVNANYSVTVHAATDVWNTSTTYYNISTYFTPTVISTTENDVTIPTVAADSPEHSKRLPLVLIGTAVLLILLITLVVILMCILRLCTRKSELANSDDEMKLETLPYGLTPNPIYDGPVYDTVKEPFKTLQPQPPPTRPPTADSMYTETPSNNKQTNLRGSDYEELTPHYKGGVEDCYVQMQSCNKQ